MYLLLTIAIAYVRSLDQWVFLIWGSPYTISTLPLPFDREEKRRYQITMVGLKLYKGVKLTNYTTKRKLWLLSVHLVIHWNPRHTHICLVTLKLQGINVNLHVQITADFLRPTGVCLYATVLYEIIDNNCIKHRSRFNLFRTFMTIITLTY